MFLYLIKINFGSSVRLRSPVKKSPASLHQSTSHFDVMVRKVKEQHLHAKQSFAFRKHLELDHLADEPDHLKLGLDFHLVLFSNLPAKLLLEILSQIGSDLGHARIQGCHKSRIKREQVLSVPVDSK